MKISFLIVTKNRPEELCITLNKISEIFDTKEHEVLVFIDGCEQTQAIKSQYSWVKWFETEHSISASPARNFLYKQALGEIFIGLDDDAHLISHQPIKTITNYLDSHPKLGILAFFELKGIFEKPEKNIIDLKANEFLTNEFIGCGFAIRKSVYDQTNGFPTWMDIYGEETCLSIEVLDLNYEILFTNSVVVNHRVNREKRKLQGRNYFRFEKQLVNSFKIYIIYSRNPSKKIIRLLWHNFKKYALSDFSYFSLYIKGVVTMIIQSPKLLKERNKMSVATQQKFKILKSITY